MDQREDAAVIPAQQLPQMSVPFEAMSSALNSPLAHRMGEGSRVRADTHGDAVLRMLVVRQVFIERRARGHAGLLQLNDHERQAVDEGHQIRAAGVERARDADLADQQEIIVRRMLPIHHPQPLGLLAASGTPSISTGERAAHDDLVQRACIRVFLEDDAMLEQVEEPLPGKPPTI